MVLLDQLRAGIARLIKEQAIFLPVMCSIRASKLALSPDYKVLADGLALDRRRFRDTVLFFLQTLDQQSPAQAALDAELQAEMNPHLLDGIRQHVRPRWAIRTRRLRVGWRGIAEYRIT